MTEIEARRSVRTYLDLPVEAEKLSRLLKAARLAPSGSNTQPWAFLVVKERETREKIAAAVHNQHWMAQAPVHIVCVGDVRSRIPEDAGPLRLDENSPQEELKQVIRDTAIAAEHIVLEAQAVGLSTCWTAWFRQDELRPLLGIPEDKYVLCVLTVGYSDSHPDARPRKPLDSMLHLEKW
ncbi:nitroreductase family protein [Caproicibacter sp.]|uniref:nitroreductase family protein n=1 Tax=Caproicibacter sp. TaxID=2814884 RepID=UPI00398A2878